MTQGQTEGGIYLSPWNHDRWLSAQRTNKDDYVFSFGWKNQELKQYTVKVELLKPTTPKNCIFMLFVDTNSPLTTKLHIVEIKCLPSIYLLRYPFWTFLDHLTLWTILDHFEPFRTKQKNFGWKNIWLEKNVFF